MEEKALVGMTRAESRTVTEEQLARNAAEVKTVRANLRQTAKNG